MHSFVDNILISISHFRPSHLKQTNTALIFNFLFKVWFIIIQFVALNGRICG